MTRGFGMVKLWLGRSFAVVGVAYDTGEESVAAPGTVMAAGADVVVATVSTDVRLGGRGRPLRCAFSPGQVLPRLTAAHAQRLSEAYADAVRVEPRWVRRLAALTPMDVTHRGPARPTGFHRVPVTAESREVGVAAALAFLAR